MFTMVLSSGGCNGDDGPGGDAGTDAADTNAPCPSGTTTCGSACVDTKFDPSNCGACGTTCTSGQVCSQGACGLTCLGGSALCGSQCVDTQNDPANCGTCGTKCANGEVCSQGKCGVTCLGGSKLCGSQCVDTQNDPTNCGGCGTTCTSGQVCSVGACALSCVGGSTKCGSSCVDTQNDPAHCGSCANACANGQVCSAGVCQLTLTSALTINQVATSVDATGGATTMTVGSATGLAANQLLFVHQSQGTNAGTYELATVQSVSNNIVTLTAALAHDYSSTGGSNHAQVVVVATYEDIDVTAAGSITAPAWNGTTGGILAMKASSLSVEGTISMTGSGFRGAHHTSADNVCGYACTVGTSGESPVGVGAIDTSNNGAGGGGGAQGQDCGMGGGGAYGSVGGDGVNNVTGACIDLANPATSPGGATFGAADLSQTLAFGGAGGEGGADEDGNNPGPGGNGGGIVFIVSPSVTVTGSIQANGAIGGDGVAFDSTCNIGGGCGMGGGGGGAGGAVRLQSTTATLGATLVTAQGAIGGTCTCGATNSGAGGDGRIGVKGTTITGTTAPTFDTN